MEDPGHYLLALARRCAAVYAKSPLTTAIMVTGSVAEGRADFYSDIDMCVYYHELPLVAELTAARHEIDGGDRIWAVGDVAAGAVMEAYPLEGVECQVVHTTVAAWERDMATVLEQLEVASPLQKALSGMLTCLPLYGEDLILQWKERAGDYPDRLAHTMVERYLTFFPVWAMPERFVRRDGSLWLHQVLVEAEFNLLGTLAGLNRLYFTPFQFKGMEAFVGKMRLAPPNLALRLKQLLVLEPLDAIEQLRRLVVETIELVEQHAPTVETSTIRQQLEKRQQQWSIPGERENHSEAGIEGPDSKF